jgi:hypothetical protein
MRALLVPAAVVAIAAGCLGGSSFPPPRPPASTAPTHAGAGWLARFAAREARTLGDPTVRSALVAPITAAQARLVFAHRRRAYPGHTSLLVLRGDFVSPRSPCPPEARGCGGFGPDRLYRWYAMLASPTLGRAWRLFGIGGDGHPPAFPVALRRIALPPAGTGMPTGRLLRTALRAAGSMNGSSLSAFGIARISAAQAAGVFAGQHRGGFLIVERGIFRHPPGGRPGGRWFAWAALKYGPSAASAPRAFAALQPPHDPQRPLPGIRLAWRGIPAV